MEFTRAFPSIAAFAFAALIAGPAGAGDDVSGKWQAQLKGDSGTSTEYVADLEQKGETVTGAFVSPRTGNKYPLEEGSFKAGVLKFRVPTKRAQVEAKLVAGRLEGSFTFEDLKGTFTASRAGAAGTGKAGSPVGKWAATVVYPNGQAYDGTLEISERDGKLMGKVSREGRSIDLKTVKVEGEKLIYSLVMPNREGSEIEVIVESVFEGPDRLKGTWRLADGSQSGEVRAKRETPAAAALLQKRYLVTAAIPDGQTLRMVLELRVEGNKLGGVFILPGNRRVEIRSGTWTDGRLEAEADVPYEGQEPRVRISGKMGEKGVLKGTWSTDQGSGDWIGRPMAEL